MDLRFTPEEIAFRDEVRSFIASHLPASIRDKLVAGRIRPFNVPRSDPDKISVNVRCLDDIDIASLKPTRFFDGRNWEAAMARRQDSGRV